MRKIHHHWENQSECVECEATNQRPQVDSKSAIPPHHEYGEKHEKEN